MKVKGGLISKHDPRYRFVLKPDPRVHFLLARGGMGSPLNLFALKPLTLEDDLRSATEEFLSSIEIDKLRKEVLYPFLSQKRFTFLGYSTSTARISARMIQLCSSGSRTICLLLIETS